MNNPTRHWFRKRKGEEGHAATPKKKSRAGVKKPFPLRFGAQEQIVFAKRLGMILKSGMPIMEGLNMLQGQASSGSSSYVFKSLVDHISEGQPLSSGLRKFEKLFGDFCINIVKVGETSGTLHENLEYLAEELKKKQALRKKVIGALVYPAVIVFATVGISLVLTVYIFPKITPIFQSFKAELPITTRILIAVSNFLLKDGLWVIVGFIVVLIGYFFALRLKPVHLFFDRLLLRLPLFGKLSQYYNLANISRTMGLLLKSDVRIVNAFAIVADSTRNQAYKNALVQVAEEVSKGQKVSVRMAEYPRLFPPMFSQMLSVGESTGNLSGSLIYVSDMYDEEISDLTKNLTTMLEPILMVVMGIVVGFIAISIITPIYGITQQLTPYK